MSHIACEASCVRAASVQGAPRGPGAAAPSLLLLLTAAYVIRHGRQGGSELLLRSAPWVGNRDPCAGHLGPQVSFGGSDPGKGPSPEDVGVWEALEGPFWAAALLPHLHLLTPATLCEVGSIITPI